MPQPNTILGDRSVVAPELLALVRPTPVDSVGAEPPENSEVRKIADDLLGALKYSFASVAANPDVAVRPDTIESLFQQALSLTSPDTRVRVRSTAAALVSSSAAARVAVFGRAGEREAAEHIGAAGGFDRYGDALAPLALDTKLLGVAPDVLRIPRGLLQSTTDGLLIPKSAIAGGFEEFEAAATEVAGRRAVGEAQIVADEGRLADVWGSLAVEDRFVGIDTDEYEAFAPTDRLGFWITRVKCIDETNPEFWGDDEIALAGVSVDETGDTKKIGEVHIGDGFDDGASRSYADWRYHDFNLGEGRAWPKTYVVTLLLAEKDNGGLANVLNAVWEKVGAEAKRAISNAVASVATSLVGPAIAKAIGDAVAWIVDRLIGWIISAFEDDVFPAHIAKVTTPSMSARWNYPSGAWGNPSSGIRTANFYGHGGHYAVDYYWKFHS